MMMRMNILLAHDHGAVYVCDAHGSSCPLRQMHTTPMSGRAWGLGSHVHSLQWAKPERFGRIQCEDVWIIVYRKIDSKKEKKERTIDDR